MAVCPGCDSGRADVQDRCCGKRCLARRLAGGIFSKSEYFKTEIVARCRFCHVCVVRSRVGGIHLQIGVTQT